MSKLTQQDLQFVAEFLKDNFVVKYDADGRKTTVKLERVAQYLKKEDLQYPPPTAGNPWIKFLEEHPAMHDTGLVFPNYPEKSLVTLFADVKKVIDVAVKGTWNVLHKTAALRSFQLLHKSNKKQPSVPMISSIGCPNYSYTVVTDQSTPCSRFYLLREHTRDDGPLEAVLVSFQRDDAKEHPKQDKNKQVMNLQYDIVKQTEKGESESNPTQLTEKDKSYEAMDFQSEQTEKEKIDDPKQTDEIFPCHNSKQPDTDKTPQTDNHKPTDKDKDYLLLDVKFYSQEVISVLLAEDGCPVLFQLPLRHLVAEMRPIERLPGETGPSGVPIVHGSSFLERGSYKRMEGVRASHMAVSGSRKVVCVLFASRRQVRRLSNYSVRTIYTRGPLNLVLQPKAADA